MLEVAMKCIEIVFFLSVSLCVCMFLCCTQPAMLLRKTSLSFCHRNVHHCRESEYTFFRTSLCCCCTTETKKKARTPITQSMGANISCCDGPLGSLSVAEQQHLTSQRHAPSSEAPPLLPHHLSGFAPLHTTTPCELGGAGSTNRCEERGSPSASGGMWRSSAMASSARLTASDNMTTIEEGHADMALRIPSPAGEEEEACASFLVVGASADTAQFEVVAEEQQHHAPMLACGASSAPTIDRQPPIILHAPMARVPSGSSSVPTTATTTANTSSSQPTAVTQSSTPRVFRAFVSVVDSMDLIDEQLEKRTSKVALSHREREPTVLLDDQTSRAVFELELPMSAFSPETSFT